MPLEHVTRCEGDRQRTRLVLPARGPASLDLSFPFWLMRAEDDSSSTRSQVVQCCKVLPPKVHGSHTSALPGSLLEMQNLGPHPRPTESEFVF